MRLIQNIKRKSATRNTVIVLTAIILSAAAATHALAAGPKVGGAGGGGHIVGGSGGASPDGIPPMSPPVFNPSTPYTVPQSPRPPFRLAERFSAISGWWSPFVFH